MVAWLTSKKSISMQAKIHTHAHHTGTFKQVCLTKVTQSTEAESVVFLSPLYSLVYTILDWGLNRVIGTLLVTSSAGRDVFLQSFFSAFVTLNVCNFLLYHLRAENHDIGWDLGITAHSPTCVSSKRKKKQQINIHTLSKQTDCCLAVVLITLGIQVISFPQCGPRPS